MRYCDLMARVIVDKFLFINIGEFLKNYQMIININYLPINCLVYVQYYLSTTHYISISYNYICSSYFCCNERIFLDI